MSELRDRIIGHDRVALARAITLVESTRDDHRRQAVELLDSVMPATGGATRLGVSGSPGVGKSTFIDQLGLVLIEHGHRPAVLTIDPSSARTGGSILGDKTRMSELASHPEAFIRPSPSGGRYGGIAGRSRESLLLCESAGFDVVIVETVGVGQSETAVADMTDLFVLLVGPGSGDDLQGIKRGVMELADLLFVTKADGENVRAATRTAADYRHAVDLLRPKHDELPTGVSTCSALDPASVRVAWSAMRARWDQLDQLGVIERLRRHQRVEAVRTLVGDLVLERVASSLPPADNDGIMQSVADGRRASLSAAVELVDAISPSTMTAGSTAQASAETGVSPPLQ